MPLLEAVRMALHTLGVQKLKSFFSLIGVMIGVTFLIAVVSIIQGMNVYMEDQFANRLVGVNTLQVRRLPNLQTGSVTSEQWREWQRRPRLTTRDAAYLAERMRTPVVFSRVCGDGLEVRYGGRSATGIEVTGADATVFAIKRYALTAGRPFSPQEVRAGAQVAVVGDLVRERFFEGRDPIGKVIVLGGLPHRVIGVVEKQGTLFGFSLDRFVLVPFESPVRRQLCASNYLDYIDVQAADAATMLVAKDEIESLLRIRRQLRPTEDNDFSLQTAEGALEGWRKISTVLFAALPGLVATSLVVGGIVIMNIMLMAVSERTREIGLRKALGARREDILAQFVVESATLSTVGAIIGIGLGIGLAFLVKAATPFPAAIAPWSVGLAVVLGIAVGMTAGIYPASRAARLDPIAALRAE